MLVINIFFYVLIACFFYKLVFEIYNSKKIAMLSSILLISNYSIINFGLAYLVDMGGWFFFILSSYYAVKYYKNSKNKYFFLAIFSSSVGFLFKEYGALGLVSLSLLILISNKELILKIKKIIWAGFLFSIIPAVYYLLFYFKFHYTYFDWYSNNLIQYAAGSYLSNFNYKIALLFKVLGWLFFAGWPIFLYGLWEEKKYFNKERMKIILAILPASLFFIFWPALDQRIAFILVPWLAMISGFGLSKIKNKYILSLLLLIYIMVNYNIQYLMNIIDVPF